MDKRLQSAKAKKREVKDAYNQIFVVTVSQRGSEQE